MKRDNSHSQLLNFFSKQQQFWPIRVVCCSEKLFNWEEITKQNEKLHSVSSWVSYDWLPFSWCVFFISICAKAVGRFFPLKLLNIRRERHNNRRLWFIPDWDNKILLAIIKNWNFQFTFSYLFSAKTLSVSQLSKVKSVLSDNMHKLMLRPTPFVA